MFCSLLISLFPFVSPDWLQTPRDCLSSYISMQNRFGSELALVRSKKKSLFIFVDGGRPNNQPLSCFYFIYVSVMRLSLRGCGLWPTVYINDGFGSSWRLTPSICASLHRLVIRGVKTRLGFKGKAGGWACWCVCLSRAS
ncbi:hypothetical protein B0T26DRAFT_469841 [Lasiosphaeria miniovina]|uniref:Secreted protein n=1 Tax=Lasiosphaeria miniovina TaxID=1954250 RepID=A0AA40DMX8_9PEZI|nr:uncharacterized protein B0T26DRAFT_469841 [Lasiosphaeria miniovina]KAK0706732.1 hypothetical protein B0T26DRAFT_469841 [Lasiosphaeria miniovina]